MKRIRFTHLCRALLAATGFILMPAAPAQSAASTDAHPSHAGPASSSFNATASAMAI